MMSRQQLGSYGESLAVQHLTARGYTVLARNWRCRAGELDIIVSRNNMIAAVEVKTRRSAQQGSPLEAITADKAVRLRRLLCLWLDEHPQRAPQVRVDVMGILLEPSSPPRVDHLEGIL